MLFSCIRLGSAEARKFVARGRPYVDVSGAAFIRETYRECELFGWHRAVCSFLSPFTALCNPESYGKCRDVIEVIPAPELLPCDTLECSVTRTVESMVSFVEYAGRNPITVWWRIGQWAAMEMSSKVSFILQFFGAAFLLIILNVGALFVSRIMNILVWFCRLPFMIWNMPVLALLRRCCRFVLGTFVDVGGGEKKQKAKKEVLGVARGSNAVGFGPGGTSSSVGADAELGSIAGPVVGLSTSSSTPTVGAIMGPAERIAILEQKLHEMNEMSQKRQSGARVGARRASTRQRCQFCRFPGHVKRDCLKRMLANGEITREEHEDRLRLVRAGYDTGIRDSQEVAMTSEAPSIPALLHTPIFVNGIKLDRGIIDIGAQANIMPLSVVTKHG